MKILNLPVDLTRIDIVTGSAVHTIQIIAQATEYFHLPCAIILVAVYYIIRAHLYDAV